MIFCLQLAVFFLEDKPVLLTFHSNNTDSQNACVSMAGCEEVMPFPYEPPDQKEL